MINKNEQLLIRKYLKNKYEGIIENKCFDFIIIIDNYGYFCFCTDPYIEYNITFDEFNQIKKQDRDKKINELIYESI